MKRRTGLKEKNMRRLRVQVSISSYEKLRSFAPDHGAGAILEHMIERQWQKREKKTSSSGREPESL